MKIDSDAAREGTAIEFANSVRTRRPKRPAKLKRRKGPLGPGRKLERKRIPTPLAVPEHSAPAWLEELLRDKAELHSK